MKKRILGKKRKPEAAAPEDTAPHGGIDDISIDDLEKPAEKPAGDPGSGQSAEAAKPKPPGKAIPSGKKKPKQQKLSDQDKSKALGIAATVVCVGGLAIFVLYQMFSGLPSDPGGRTVPGESDPPAQSEPAQIPGQTGDTGQLEFEPPASQGQNQAKGSVYNRGQWDDYKLADEDGNQAADSPSDQLEGGTRYWVRDRQGNNVFKIIIPAGFVAGDLGDCITVGTGDYAATGSEPMTFFWRDNTETRLLLERGYYDIAGNATGYDQYDIRALGYYLFRDENGEDWPVVTAVMTRDETNPDIDPYIEYRIVVGKPAEDGRWLTGTIPAESFSDISSTLYPNISAFAMGLFPSQSAPDFPAEWDIPPVGGAQQEPEPSQGPEPGTETQEPGSEPVQAAGTGNGTVENSPGTDAYQTDPGGTD